MEEKRNLCAPIPLSLHQRLRTEQEQRGQTLADYITDILREHFEGGARTMNANNRTIAFQVPEELFGRLKLKEMYDTVLNMLKTTHEALQAKDIAMAKSVFEKDEILDELNREAIDTLTGYATEHTASIRLCLETAGIFRKLERAGDHINNLAEETIFYLDAEVLKHNKTLFLPEHTV